MKVNFISDNLSDSVSTFVDSTVEFNAYVHDNSEEYGGDCTFFWNASGSWENETCSFNQVGAYAWAVINKTIPNVENKNVYWYMNFSDPVGLSNVTPIFNFTVNTYDIEVSVNVAQQYIENNCIWFPI